MWATAKDSITLQVCNKNIEGAGVCHNFRVPFSRSAAFGDKKRRALVLVAKGSRRKHRSILSHKIDVWLNNRRGGISAVS